MSMTEVILCFFFFFQAEDGIRDFHVTGVQTCALPISDRAVLATGAGGEAAPRGGRADAQGPARSGCPRAASGPEEGPNAGSATGGSALRRLLHAAALQASPNLPLSRAHLRAHGPRRRWLSRRDRLVRGRLPPRRH